MSSRSVAKGWHHRPVNFSNNGSLAYTDNHSAVGVANSDNEGLSFEEMLNSEPPTASSHRPEVPESSSRPATPATLKSMLKRMFKFSASELLTSSSLLNKTESSPDIQIHTHGLQSRHVTDLSRSSWPVLLKTLRRAAEAAAAEPTSTQIEWQSSSRQLLESLQEVEDRLMLTDIELDASSREHWLKCFPRSEILITSAEELHKLAAGGSTEHKRWGIIAKDGLWRQSDNYAEKWSHVYNKIHEDIRRLNKVLDSWIPDDKGCLTEFSKCKSVLTADLCFEHIDLQYKHILGKHGMSAQEMEEFVPRYLKDSKRSE